MNVLTIHNQDTAIAVLLGSFLVVWFGLGVREVRHPRWLKSFLRHSPEMMMRHGRILSEPELEEQIARSLRPRWFFIGACRVVQIIGALTALMGLAELIGGT